jgi:hypothetical protein
MAVKGYRVLRQQTGMVNGEPWPEPGDVVRLEESVAEGMVGAGDLEEAKAEKPKAEKRPAAQKSVPKAESR